jgi:hypothetical protein
MYIVLMGLFIALKTAFLKRIQKNAKDAASVIVNAGLGLSAW